MSVTEFPIVDQAAVKERQPFQYKYSYAERAGRTRPSPEQKWEAKRLEDRAWVGPNASGRLCAVECDGASRTDPRLAENIMRRVAYSKGSDCNALEQAVRYGWLDSRSERGGYAACTVTSMVIDGDICNWIHVGDDRLDLLRGGKLYTITQPHDEYHQAIKRYQRQGLSLEEAEVKLEQSGRNVRKMKQTLTRCIDTQTDQMDPIDQGAFRLFPGDVLVLRSDGPEKYIEDQDFQMVLEKGLETDDPSGYVCDMILNRAMASSTKRVDDLCVAVISVQ